MLEKKGKEYKESFSKAGKESAIQAFLKLSGYKVSSPNNNRKKKKSNIYLDNLSKLKDNLVIIKVYETSLDEEMKKEKEKQKEIEKQKQIKKHSKTKFYHNIIYKKESDLKNDFGPPCTKYNPKMTSIFPKLIIGPNWNTISGRKYKKIEPDEKDFLITHDSIIDNEKKSLVNMNKDTQRGNFLGIDDVRIRTDKKFDYKLNFKIRKKIAKLIKQKQNKAIKSRKNNLKLSLSFSNLFNENAKKSKSNMKNETDKNNNIINNDNKTANLKSGKKLASNKTIQSRNKSNNQEEDKEKDNETENEDIYPKKHIRTIDFDKILSREKRDKALTKRRLLDIFHDADHSPIYERQRVFTYYTIKNNPKIHKKFTGFKSYINYDPNKAYRIRTVHPLDKVSNFNLILARPNENKNLPSYMQKMFNRNEEYTFNEKALQLNEYSKQKLGKTTTSFFPKKSFNNIVNMNIMTGKLFEDDYKIEDLDKKRREIKNMMKIKNRNLGKLIKEGGLKRFDNFSLRTFHKTKNIMIGDLNKYLLGLKES